MTYFLPVNDIKLPISFNRNITGVEPAVSKTLFGSLWVVIIPVCYDISLDDQFSRFSRLNILTVLIDRPV
jgi:hypothetical protein